MCFVFLVGGMQQGYDHEQLNSNLIFPLSTAGHASLKSVSNLCDEGGMMHVSILCHEDAGNHGEVRGWVYDVPAEAPALALPVGCNMCDGVSVFQLDLDEKQVLSRMQSIELSRECLQRAVRSITEYAKKFSHLRASWARCGLGKLPSNLTYAVRDRDGTIRLVSAEHEVSNKDAEEWVPEISLGGFVGLYHSLDHSTRQVRLYLAVGSYLQGACLEFAELVKQVGDATTADAVARSQELYWLRTACSRNRSRVAEIICKAMHMPLKTVRDFASCNGTSRLAVPCIETLHHNLVCLPDGKVRVLNHSVHTGSLRNGSVCTMAPWEGICIFHGFGASTSSHQKALSFGGPYGNGFLPTCAPRVWPSALRKGAAFQLIHDQEQATAAARKAAVQEYLSLVSQLPNATGDMVTRLSERHSRLHQIAAQVNLAFATSNKQQRQHYLVLDEAALQAMAKMGWCRSNGLSILSTLAFAAHG